MPLVVGATLVSGAAGAVTRATYLVARAVRCCAGVKTRAASVESDFESVSRCLQNCVRLPVSSFLKLVQTAVVIAIPTPNRQCVDFVAHAAVVCAVIYTELERLRPLRSVCTLLRCPAYHWWSRLLYTPCHHRECRPRWSRNAAGDQNCCCGTDQSGVSASFVPRTRVCERRPAIYLLFPYPTLYNRYRICCYVEPCRNGQGSDRYCCRNSCRCDCYTALYCKRAQRYRRGHTSQSYANRLYNNSIRNSYVAKFHLCKR